MACQSLVATGRECGKNVKSGIVSDIYLVAFDDLDVIPGTQEVYTLSTGLVTAIGTTASSKFVKYSSVAKSVSYKEDFTGADNGTYDIVKEVAFNLNNFGSVDVVEAVENLIANPVAVLLKLKNGSWITAGLNGQMVMKTSAGTIDEGSNGRVITLSGSDENFTLVVTPSLITTIIE